MPRAGSSSGLGSERGRAAHASSGWLASVYREHAPAIFQYLLARTHDPDRAEDLTQEVFLAALAAAKRLQADERPLRPWLHAVARHRYVEDLREWIAEGRLLPLEAADSVGAPEHDLDSSAAVVLRHALLSLPPAQRRICAMRLFEGRSFAEIHEELAASEPACRMQFVRGRRSLQKALEDAGVSL